MPRTTQFAFSDTSTFDQNIADFATELARLDAVAGIVLQGALFTLAIGEQDKGALLDALYAALAAPPSSYEQSTPNSQPQGMPPGALLAPATPPPTAIHWFLEGLEIEGFRGINNEGAPLALKFKPECVSSISAPNGVGKSSIYDALSFALRGKIDKLDQLLQAERGQDYYLNRFHPAGVGTVKLTLRPDNGGTAVTLTITRNAAGQRSVTGHPNAEVLLAELNREFVLLDGQTFQSFMDETALNRGRSFSGLLGLARYSALRQQLQQLCQTRFFNSHFDTSAQAAKKAGADRAITAARTAIATDYEVLVQEELGTQTGSTEAQVRCHASLKAIPTLSSFCSDLNFMQISGDDCHAAVNTAEGGAERQRLAILIQTEARWKAANKEVPTRDDVQTLHGLARAREEALAATSGEALQRLYKLSDEVMSASDWPSPNLCPTCGVKHDISVLDHVQDKLSRYDAVEKATIALAKEWIAKGWSELEEVEKLTIGEEEALLLARLKRPGEVGTIASAEVTALETHLATIRTKAEAENPAPRRRERGVVADHAAVSSGGDTRHRSGTTASEELDGA